MGKNEERKVAAVAIGVVVGGMIAWALLKLEGAYERHIELPEDEIPKKFKKAQKKAAKKKAAKKKR